MALTARIKKRYGDFLLDVAFTAGDGERLALLGASGSGKSVTLKCLAGIHRPDEGRIEVDGRVLFDSASGVDLSPQRRHVGYLFQQYALFPNMTVEQNIAVGVRDRARRRKEVPRLIRLLRLEGQEKKRPGQLSGGQQQRVALGRILASQPDVILLDEPFSALDSHLKWQLELELQDLLAQFPGPVVWVSHDLGEVWRGCPRVCVLDGGRASPVMEMGRLMTDPVTVSAARLSATVCRSGPGRSRGPCASRPGAGRSSAAPSPGGRRPPSWPSGRSTSAPRSRGRPTPSPAGWSGRRRTCPPCWCCSAPGGRRKMVLCGWQWRRTRGQISPNKRRSGRRCRRSG